MNELGRRIRHQIEIARRGVQRSPTSDYESLRSFEVLPARLNGSATQRAVIALRTRGCLWFRGFGRGCSHCGLVVDGLWDPDLDEDAAFDEFRAKLEGVEEKGIPVVCLYVAGSFLDDKEVSPANRARIAEALGRSATTRQVILETRPEFVREGTIRELTDRLGDKELIVGIGFDSLDERVRTLCLNKLCRQEQFEQAAERVRDEGATLMTYIVLKPPFLSEKEAIEEAVRTGRYAFDLGSRVVSIEPLSVQDGTLADRLWEHGLHRPPWLWSLVEVIERLAPHGEILVGGVVVYPAANRYPSNCEFCSKRIFERIQRFNIEQDPRLVAGLECRCRKAWEAVLAGCRPLEENVAGALEVLERLGDAPD